MRPGGPGPTARDALFHRDAQDAGVRLPAVLLLAAALASGCLARPPPAATEGLDASFYCAPVSPCHASVERPGEVVVGARLVVESALRGGVTVTLEDGRTLGGAMEPGRNAWAWTLPEPGAGSWTLTFHPVSGQQGGVRVAAFDWIRLGCAAAEVDIDPFDPTGAVEAARAWWLARDPDAPVAGPPTVDKRFFDAEGFPAAPVACAGGAVDPPAEDLWKVEWAGLQPVFVEPATRAVSLAPVMPTEVPLPHCESREVPATGGVTEAEAVAAARAWWAAHREPGPPEHAPVEARRTGLIFAGEWMESRTTVCDGEVVAQARDGWVVRFTNPEGVPAVWTTFVDATTGEALGGGLAQ